MKIKTKVFKTLLLLILVFIAVIVFFAGCKVSNGEVVPTEEKVQSTKELVEKIILYESGKQEVVNIKSEDGIGIANLLTSKLHELNLQAKCAFSKEDIQEIKQKDRIVEVIFKNPADITISQWVEPDERYHIPVDKKGYRILENVKTSLFILEDNQDRGLEAHILVGHEVEGEIGHSCWTININQEEKPQLDQT